MTAAAWITIVLSAITAALFGFTGLGLFIARDQVITEMERVPEFQDANIDADAAVGVLVAVIVGLVVWAIIAIVLAVLVMRRSNVARILLVISSAVVALFSLLGVTSGVSAITLVAAIAVIVLLFVGGAGDWFKGLSSSGAGAYPGYAGQPGDPYGNQYGAQPGQQSSPQYPPPEQLALRPGQLLRSGRPGQPGQPLRPAAAERRGRVGAPAAGLPGPLTTGLSATGRRRRAGVRPPRSRRAPCRTPTAPAGGRPSRSS